MRVSLSFEALISYFLVMEKRTEGKKGRRKRRTEERKGRKEKGTNLSLPENRRQTVVIALSHELIVA